VNLDNVDDKDLKAKIDKLSEESLKELTNKVVQKALTELKWLAGHGVLTILHFTPAVIISGPAHLIYGGAHLVSELKDSDDVVNTLYKKSFQECVQKSKVKQSNKVDSPINIWELINSDKFTDQNQRSKAKRSFKALIQAFNCAFKVNQDQTAANSRTIMKGLYNTVVQDDDSNVRIGAAAQKLISEYYFESKGPCAGV